MVTSLGKRLQAALDSRNARSNLRSLEPIPAWAPKDIVPHPNLVDFSSNDYLSFASSPYLRQLVLDSLTKAKESPLGPSSSRLLDGNTPLHQNLERNLTQFFKGQSGLLFNSGFDANVSIWSTIPGSKDWVVYDSLIHASIHDGLRLSRTPPSHQVPFLHNSLASLEKVLQTILSNDVDVKSGRTNIFISVEALYSMDGDLCPLKEIITLVINMFEEHGNAYIVIDEAHSTGLFESCGRGLVCAQSSEDKVLIRLHTFGKAVACSGAIVLLPPLLREYLINYARPLIFSTTMTHMNIIGLSTSIGQFKTENRKLASKQLKSLFQNLTIQLFQLLTKYHISPLVTNTSRPQNVIFTIPQSTIDMLDQEFFSPIIPILTSHPRDLARFLYSKGFLVRPIGTPTVPSGREQVRVCIHANNTSHQIECLVNQIDTWLFSHLHKSHL
ncbi:hypothetical protein Pst134EA_000889 [Puccinia striiformis f. sp. tritici]|uniref:Aminotransferase class I/classII large domain-containing protein n=1 Tax=Puccinia striiformis TaxID=27350 RepID=A0A2S4VQ34_9BASI|nr:hypothetical protein Pst134EA_000889 [Puccinia striiformis f. sp. tritici]KAH9473825.1 hypothetical protein Pst134EA_000889 [Puccinia striiformis f. sp. tritici]POW11667.1 hypothetical protein PSTT_05111 [Puccinia striiformis]